MSRNTAPPSQQITALDRVNRWLVLVIGLGTAFSATGIAIWKFTEWAHRLNDAVAENVRIKDFIVRQSQVTAASTPTGPISPTVFKRTAVQDVHSRINQR